jgi:outer membrane protein OmpA-like peptidoglycan-associated protein
MNEGTGIRPAGRLLIIMAIVGTLFYLLFFGPLNQYIPGKEPAKAVVAKRVNLGNIANTKSIAAELPLPSADPAPATNTTFKYEIMAWNSQFSLMLANGGIVTTSGSLMEKYGVNITLERQDDCEKMKADLVAFATELKDGNPYPSEKPAFVAVMGDGAAQFIAALNPVLEKLGTEYRAKVIGSAGYSYGEDKLMGPPEWKKNPGSMRGCVISGYLRDGDWNIAMKYTGDNGIPNNPDETTYDPNAVNWVAANDFLDAPAKLIAGYEEDRPVVINGKKTGKTQRIKVQGTVTWTPGDVNVVEQCDQDIINIVSTREYAGQMPNAIIGIDVWCKDNRKMVEGMLRAIGEAGDQIKRYDAAKQRAAEISASVYKEKDAEYWLRYHDGTEELNKHGSVVQLGGSKPNNIADMVLLFGPSGLFKSTYVAFGNVVIQQYPKLVPSVPAPEIAIDGSYVLAVAKETNTNTSTADRFTFKKGSTLKEVVGKRKYSIQFEIGRSAIRAGQENTLEALKDELAVSLSLKAVIHGHTDNTGTPEGNMRLSADRAQAVQYWLEGKYQDLFPEGRLNIVAHGQTRPVADNDTETGRAKNRRVEIVTGTE